MLMLVHGIVGSGDSTTSAKGGFPHRRAARRGQGGRLTTLNFRPGAVTPLNLGHVLIFLSSNISRKQTRQYRKSTKEAMSGKRYAKEGEKQTIVPTKPDIAQPLSDQI